MANLNHKIRTHTYTGWYRGWIPSPHCDSAKRRLGPHPASRRRTGKAKVKRTAPDYNKLLIRPDA